MVKELIEEEDAEPLDFVSSATTTTSPRELAKRIPERIGFSLREFHRQPSMEKAFAYLRQRLEASGVFVLLVGNLGSHHTNIPVEVFRGYAIADPIAPFIVVNDQDVKVAWSFTALHEAVHLWLGSTGVSSTSTDAQIEKYCNEVAGEILMPRTEIQQLAHLGGASLEEAVEAISSFAQSRNLGRSMVAYKLLRSRVIDQAAWRDLSARFTEEWLASRERQAATGQGKNAPSYYVVRRHRLGAAFLDLVRRSMGGRYPDLYKSWANAGSEAAERRAASSRYTDANVMITASNSYYPIDQVPEFWSWLKHQGQSGNVKLPLEIMEEIQAGRKNSDDLVKWLAEPENEQALLLEEDVGAGFVQSVVSDGYATDLTDGEIEKIGRDPFLIAYGLAATGVRCVVTTEVSRPAAKRQNRKIPDVCRTVGVACCGPFELNRVLGFNTRWAQPT